MGNYKNFEIGDIIHGKNGDVKVIDKTSSSSYTLKCLNDEFVIKRPLWEINRLKDMCPICANTIVVKGINDVFTTHNWMSKYFKNIEDSFSVTYNSDKKVECACPVCGEGKIMTVGKLYSRGYSCNRCSNGSSNNEKFILSLLRQLNVKTECEKTFDWCKDDKSRKRYDFYLPDYNCIIEAHGLQHYKECGGIWSKQVTLEEQKYNDQLKEQLAKNNKIDKYIVIDCSQFELNFIKNSIINSGLFDILKSDVNKIKWESCLEDSILNSDVKIACDLWNSRYGTTTEIGVKMGYTPSTIIKYLKKGYELNWCDYLTTKKEINRQATINAQSKRDKNSYGSKKYRLLCEENQKEYKNCVEACEDLNNTYGIDFKQHGIARVCRGERKNYKGFHFKRL